MLPSAHPLLETDREWLFELDRILRDLSQPRRDSVDADQDATRDLSPATRAAVRGKLEKTPHAARLPAVFEGEQEDDRTLVPAPATPVAE